MDRLPVVGTHTRNILEQVCGAYTGRAGSLAEKGKQRCGLPDPGVEFMASFGLGVAAGRDHSALELEEILVIAHLKEKHVKLREVEEGPALSHVVLWCHGC